MQNLTNCVSYATPANAHFTRRPRRPRLAQLTHRRHRLRGELDATAQARTQRRWEGMLQLLQQEQQPHLQEKTRMPGIKSAAVSFL